MVISKQGGVQLVRWRTSRGSLVVMWNWCWKCSPWRICWSLDCLFLFPSGSRVNVSPLRGKIVEEKGWGTEQERTPAAKKLMLQLDDCRRCTGVAQGAAATLTVWDNTPKINVQLSESCCLQENLVISFRFSKRRPLRLNENLLSMVRMHLFLYLNGAAAPFLPFQSCYLMLRIMRPPILHLSTDRKTPTFQITLPVFLLLSSLWKSQPHSSFFLFPQSCVLFSFSFLFLPL